MNNIHFVRLSSQQAWECLAIDLNWVDEQPVDDSSFVLIRNSYAFPLNIHDGELIYEGTETIFRDAGIEENTLYCYTIFVKTYTDGEPIYSTSSIGRISLLSAYVIDLYDFMWKKLVWRNFRGFTDVDAMKALVGTMGKLFGNIKSKAKQIGDIYRLHKSPIEHVHKMYIMKGQTFTEDLSIDFYLNELKYCLRGMRWKGSTDGIVDYIFMLTGWEIAINFASLYRNIFYSNEYNGSITFDPIIHRSQDIGTHRDQLRRTMDYANLDQYGVGGDTLRIYIFVHFNTYRETQIYNKVSEIIFNYFPPFVSIELFKMHYSYAILDKEENAMVQYTL